MQIRQLVHFSAKMKALSSLISMACSGQTGRHSRQPVQASPLTTGIGEAPVSRLGVSSPEASNCRVMVEPQLGQATLKQGTPGLWGVMEPQRGQMQFPGPTAILPRPLPIPARRCLPLPCPLPKPKGILTSDRALPLPGRRHAVVTTKSPLRTPRCLAT
jgi:hypothetical protein